MNRRNEKRRERNEDLALSLQSAHARLGQPRPPNFEKRTLPMGDGQPGMPTKMAQSGYGMPSSSTARTGGQWLACVVGLLVFVGVLYGTYFFINAGLEHEIIPMPFVLVLAAAVGFAVFFLLRRR